MELIKEQEPKLSEFQIAKRPTYLKINLDIILKNLDILKRNISNATEVIAVVKANAYGHGAVAVTRFLEQHGYKHFAVATALEGAELRQAGVQSYIQILGNASPEEIPVLHEHQLIPTVATETFLLQWAEHWHNRRKQNGHVNGNGYHAIPNGSVVIKVDSGMSRNGCQADELPGLIEMCDTHDIPVHSIMTHFAQSWDHPEFTQAQLDLFMSAVRPYREAGVKVHVANSGAIVTKLGVDLDYVRPGISMYGQAPDGSEFGLAKTQELGLMPALSWVAKPTLVKKLPAGRVVGYDQTYILKESETIATVPLGYADGYLRNMFGQGYLTTPDGIPCPVVGRISMDAITVKLPEKCANCRTFYVTEANFNEYNSAYAICKKTNTIPYEVCTNLSRRLPRLYESGGKVSLGA